MRCCCSRRALAWYQLASSAWRAEVSALADGGWGCWQEIDYELEGRNAERFKNNFAKTPWVKVPRIYWSCTSTKVLPAHAGLITPLCGAPVAL